MLLDSLKIAISYLDNLIDITHNDLDDIKKAKHQSIFDRVKEKK